MNIEVDIWAVLLATASAMAIGAVWYAKGTFGTAWMKLVNLQESSMKAKAASAMGLALILSFTTAFVLAHIIALSHSYYGNSYLQDALATGLWVWLGFVGARILMHDTFEQRRKLLSLINISHELITILVMSLIIGLME